VEMSATRSVAISVELRFVVAGVCVVVAFRVFVVLRDGLLDVAAIVLISPLVS
jgi:hypothetical protein